jgi:DNA-binding CsgD family transcriptional regulator
VTANARSQPLAGLVSEEAEDLYARLLHAGALEVGLGPDDVDLDSNAARELLEARVAYQSQTSADRLLPVQQPTALQLLLSSRHEFLAAQQRQLISGWELLDQVLSLAPGAGASGAAAASSLVEVVSGQEAVNKVSVELQHAVRRELLGLSIGRMSEAMTDKILVTPPEPIVSRGGRFRMIYDGEFAADRVGARLMEKSVAAGEEARIRASLPLKMLHVDDSVALVALTSTGIDGSLLVHSPQVLAALRDWFERLWHDSATTPVHGTAQRGLSPAHRQVLRLMSSGMSDEAIARASTMSVRTVRRHIAAILELLGVNSRFAAGAMAARRGLI